jgi:glycolate oxidase iron-sulfur subunit
MNAQTTPELLTTPRYRTLLSRCIHCGLCLPSCPTYAAFGTEMDSPRGRIALMRALSEGRIEMNLTFRQHMLLCLACRACEPACPSGVQYGALAETTRSALQETQSLGILQRAIRRLVLRELLAHSGRLRFIAWWARLYEKLGVQRVVRAAKFLPETLRAAEALLPPLSANRPDYRFAAPSIGSCRGSVAFFHGCIQDAFLAQVNAATIRVLQRNGYTVHIPVGQTCCGAAQLHVGEHEMALDLARRNIDAFDVDRYDAIINNAGGCGAILKDYANLLENDPAYGERARRFVSKVKDISEFLVGHLHVPPTGTVKARATYSDSCHLRNVQGVVVQPRDLLRQIPGVELVELTQPDRCCGSAGVYNIVQVQTAEAVLETKMADIAASGADTIVVSNAGCQLQLVSGVRRAGLRARVVHVVELLDESYAAGM